MDDIAAQFADSGGRTDSDSDKDKHGVTALVAIVLGDAPLTAHQDIDAVPADCSIYVANEGHCIIVGDAGEAVGVVTRDAVNESMITEPADPSYSHKRLYYVVPVPNIGLIHVSILHF